MTTLPNKTGCSESRGSVSVQSKCLWRGMADAERYDRLL
jgi:hypothetical protein